METVGAFEAKTKLSALLGRVEMGETIIITRHGRPVARLVPAGSDDAEATINESISGLIEFRKHHPMKYSELRSFIEEGRKY